MGAFNQLQTFLGIFSVVSALKHFYVDAKSFLKRIIVLYEVFRVWMDAS